MINKGLLGLLLASLILTACGGAGLSSTPTKAGVLESTNMVLPTDAINEIVTETAEPVSSPSVPHPSPTLPAVPTSSGWPPQTNAAEIHPPEMRKELTILSNLIGFQIFDIHRGELGIAADYVINTCETYIIYISMNPEEAIRDQADMRMLLPFEMVTINSGVLDAEAKAIGLNLPPEPFQTAPIVPDTLKLTPTDWEPGVQEYWNPFVRLGVLSTECLVPDPASGELVPVYKTAYASHLLGAKLKDSLENELGTVVEAILEPESGKLRYYVVELTGNQGLTLVPIGKTNIPKEVLDTGAVISLVLLPENEKLFNAPRFESVEEAISDSAISKAFGYW